MLGERIDIWSLNELKNIIKNIKETETLRDIAETRRVMYNKDSLTDAMVAGSLLSAGYLSGLAGHSTGTNAWMTDEQKARNKEKKRHFLFPDYRLEMAAERCAVRQ